MSGTGVVAEGIEFRDGRAAYRWLTAPGTTQIADSIHDIEHIHGHGGKTTVRWLDDPHPDGREKTITEVYEDRNLLATAFSLVAHRLESSVTVGDYAGGWHPPRTEDDADADEWAVTWAETPTGQVSWHVPIWLAESSALPRQDHGWDGHTRQEKNNRLAEFVDGPE